MDSTTFPTNQPDPSSDKPSIIGRTLDGRLRVVEQVGQSSAGPIYRAEYVLTGVEVTLVLLRAEREPEVPPGNAARLARQLQQLRRASEIDHPNVAAVLGVDETPDGLAYVIVEPLRGEMLADVLAARWALPLPEAVDLIQQAAAGLQAVHEAGLVHGNVSLTTLLVTRTAEDRPLVKLIGFTLTASSEPEKGDRAADVFSLGAVLHHLLTGALPGAWMTPRKPIPKRARPLLAKALAASPADRFQTVAEFVAALQELAIHRARVSALIPVIAATGAAVVGAGLWLWWGSQQRTGSAVPAEVAVTRASADSNLSAQSAAPQRVVVAAEQPIEGTWRLVAHQVGAEVLRPPRAEGFFRVRDGLIQLQLRRTVGDTRFEYYGSGGYSASPDRFSYGYDRMVWVTRRPTGVTALDTIPFKDRRVFRAHSVGPGVRYEADGGHYVLEVVGDTLNYSEAGAWVRRWIRERPTRSTP